VAYTAPLALIVPLTLDAVVVPELYRSESPGWLPTVKLYDAPATVLQLKDVSPFETPGIVAPGGGFVNTATFGAVCSVSVCGSACTELLPAVNTSVVLAPAPHPAVDTEIVAVGLLGTVTDGDPISCAHDPVCSPRLTVPK
jgi:hypothetical protein